MIEISRQVAALPPQPVSVPAVPIQSSDLRLALPKAAPPKGAGCPRLYCNAALNSRLPAAAPPKGIELRWQAPFVPAFRPTAVLQDGERVLAYGGGAWRLFDLGGKPIKDGRSGPSGVVLDAANGFFYFVNLNGFLTAQRLSDGGEEFNLNPAPGDAWPFLAREGRRFLDLAIELPKPYKNVPPNRALLEHLDLDEKVETDRVRVVTNLVAAASLELKTATVELAMHEGGLVFAVAGRVYLSSSDLQPRVALEGDFVPRSLSLDELGRVHLIVRTGEENALWVLMPDGKRTASISFKPEYGNAQAPPVIGYDHRIHLISSGIAAFDAHGDLLWEKWPRGRVAGAGVTTDGQLIVSAGDLSAYDAFGERRVLFTLPGLSLVTPAAMSAAGEIFVASSDTVFCLAPRRE